MNIVKATANKETHFISKLSDKEYQAMAYAFGKEFSKAMNKELYRLALDLLRKARDHHWWFECDCVTHDKPILFPRKIESYLTLVHLNHRGKHAPNCLFKEKKMVTGKLTVKASREYDISKPLKLCSNLSNKLAVKKDTSFFDTITSRSANPLSKLGRTLYTLINLAGLDTLTSNQFDIASQYQALHNAAKKLTLGSDIPLSQFFWTHPGQKTAAVMQVKNVKSELTKGARPFGIMMVVADEILEGNIVKSKIGDKEYQIKTADLKFSSGRLGKDAGPFLVLITITNYPDKPYWYDAYQAFAVPIYAKNCLFPVESQLERQAAFSIMQNWWPYWQRQNLQVKLFKPLFDTMINYLGEDQAVRPDFILQTTERDIVFEVMGSHEKDYLERKTKVLAAMKLKWPVVDFDAYAARQKKQWKEHIDSCLKLVTKHFFATT